MTSLGQSLDRIQIEEHAVFQPKLLLESRELKMEEKAQS